MTSAVLVSIADCMLTDYSAAFEASLISQQIVPVRGYVPEFTPSDQPVGEYWVYISPEREQTKRLNRANSLSAKYVVEVGVCCRLPDTTIASVDPAMLLIQQMADFFFDNGLSNGVAQWMENEVYAWGDKERMKFDGSFLALWDMTFEGARTKGN